MVSSKSKHPPKRLSPAQQMNRDLLIFLWAWANVVRPTPMQIYAVRDEILNISESIRKGNLNERMIAEQLELECDILTDWNRRDRG